MTNIKIQKGVPIPPPRGKYPWGDMEVGDSFVTERKGISARAAGYAKRDGTGKEVRVRSQGDGTARVWRIK